MNRLIRIGGRVERIAQSLDEIRINQGQILENFNRAKTSRNLQEYEYKVFSQWGEDGIIQRLISCIPIKNNTFIEFGVEDFSESNCRYLLINNKWSGFVIDGSAENIRRMASASYFWAHDLRGISSFITRENIEGLLQKSGFDPDIGILSIDIDGVDYWVLEAINRFRPCILITEYNAVFGSERKISVPYSASFNRTQQHFSNLYFGASLPALTLLANRKGYSLVGTNSAGVNAFFVRNDLINEAVEVMSADKGFSKSVARESRDELGNLTFIGGDARLEQIRGLPVINVETMQEEPL